MRKVKWLAVCLALVLLTTVCSGLSVVADITGKTFEKSTVYTSTESFSQVPGTFEATVRFDGSKAYPGRGGVVVGNFCDAKTPCISFEVYTSGMPRLYVIDDNATVHDFCFNELTVYLDTWVHMAVTIDNEAGFVTCYINGGEYSQTLEMTEPLQVTMDSALCIGGDLRVVNDQYFKGEISSVALYSDVRTAREVRGDSFAAKPALHDLMGYYDLAGAQGTLYDTYGTGVEFEALPSTQQWADDYQPITEYDYAFAVMGDTQIMNHRYPDKFPMLYNWIVDNAEEQKLKFVFGLGDITDKDTDAEWLLAKSLICKMNGVVPYSLVRGNHDSTGKYNTYFPLEEFKDTIDGSFKDTMMYTYQTFEVGEIKYLVLAMDINASDDALAWANDVITAHPDYNVIITTHIYLSTNGKPLADGTGTTKYGGVNDCTQWWEKMIKKHPNVVLMLSGHVPTDRIVVNQREGDNGNIVTEMLVDPQGTDVKYEGAGLIALLKFTEGGKRVNVEYYSPVHDKYFLAENQFAFDLNVIEAQDEAWYAVLLPYWPWFAAGAAVIVAVVVVLIVTSAVRRKRRKARKARFLDEINH